ncbi:MAG: hypothetical protein ACTJHT_13710 [Sphingobacterium sp.]|uniref:hypothetical protein n=1 Tax=Sphingobacterium sp. JB170 TaxID=1434842 RepID=UPI00097F2BE2|nr:hypothetical protein [Sphingobacterium sp. JB170]SJN46166.1 hypothetical protein FM107_14205 [Sphingobacterium sp. JB170]
MKKTAIILGILLILIFGSIWTLYTVRQHKMDLQYVSKSSTSILSIAVDDLILDNLWYLSSKPKNSAGIKTDNEQIKGFIFDAGILLPARIYLFGMPSQDGQFYGILPINNFDKCFSFFASNYPKKINFIDKQKSIVSVSLNKRLKVIFNNEHLVYQVDFDENEGFGNLKTLLMKPEDWSQVRTLEGFQQLKSKKHLTYVQEDGGLELEATVKKNLTEINGTWQLKQELGDEFLVRDIDTLQQTLTFWSVLPLQETPTLARLMQKYTGLDAQQLDTNYANYFDLQVKSDSVVQNDSSITYAYDDEFNPIEELHVQHNHVPNIVHVWKCNESIQDSMPDKMFYRFHKENIGTYFLNTTLDSLSTPVTSKETPYPLYCFVDFRTWPEQWNVSLFKKLKAHSLKARIGTKQKNKSTLSIKGEIHYQ